MALSFLNKKIWHPGSFSNMEKTWIAEQKHKEIERKIIERAKKIKEEKEIEEMKRIQVNKGLLPASHLNRIDFMYQCPEANKKNNPEEDYLLGKRIDEDIFHEKKNYKKPIIPKFQETYSNPKNEDFTKVHEDPMYLILKEEQRQRKEIEQNPYKMKLIFNDLLKEKENKNISLIEKEEKNYDDSDKKKKHHHHRHKYGYGHHKYYKNEKEDYNRKKYRKDDYSYKNEK